MRTRIFVILLGVAIAPIASTSLRAQRLTDITPYLISDRAAEITLARSAAPKHVSDSATVLVMTRASYVEAAHGTNGFTCMVLRSFSGNVDDPNFWNAKVRSPICFNPPASRTVFPQMLKQSESVMAGGDPKAIAEATKRAYASHKIPTPAAGSMAFMLSPRQYLLDNNPHWLPHLMFFYDRSLPVSAWGVGGETNTIIDGSGGDVTFPVITLLLPVRKWSDGTTALAATASH
ncbi:MAG: hypothetical protein ABJE10_13345 [bacterium]